MNNEANILHILNTQLESLISTELLTKAILAHYDSFKRMYDTNPIHYKVILKKGKFLLYTILAINSYCSSKKLISDARKKCLSLDVLSMNSIYSFIEYLYTNKIIEIDSSDDDKRKLNYSFTEKGEKEIEKIIKTTEPAISLLKNQTINLSSKNSIENYLKRYTEIFDCGILLFKDMNEINVFIDKDGGHLILLYIFCNQKDNVFTGSISRISFYCNVSRSHISRTITEAIELGLIKKNKNGSLLLLPAFNYIAERYMATHFICVMYCLGYL
ncbi:hypothetical protein PT300_05840 [Enterobacteriaceae bacterium ESL0689]|nr:hypothetical protein [Enterobacteriaceae bacterium ESL0689]